VRESGLFASDEILDALFDIQKKDRESIMRFKSVESELAFKTISDSDSVVVPSFIFIGNYRCQIRALEFSRSGIKLYGVPKAKGAGSRIISLPFTKIKKVKFTRDVDYIAFLISVVPETGRKIKNRINLIRSKFTFDTNSNDSKIKYIITI